MNQLTATTATQGLTVTFRFDPEEAARLREITDRVDDTDPNRVARSLLRGALGLPHPTFSAGERAQNILGRLLASKWKPAGAEARGDDGAAAPVAPMVQKRTKLPRDLYDRATSLAAADGMSFGERALIAIRRDIAGELRGRSSFEVEREIVALRARADHPTTDGATRKTIKEQIALITSKVTWYDVLDRTFCAADIYDENRCAAMMVLIDTIRWRDGETEDSPAAFWDGFKPSGRQSRGSRT